MTTPTPSSQSTSQDRISRSVVVEGDARMLERMKKQAEIRGFTILCDEREPMGDNTAPPPLAYFASSILF
jgi:hypothetical protein